MRRALPLLALFGPHAMSELSPLSGAKRKLEFGAAKADFDPGCVKTLCCWYDSPVILWGH